MGGSIGKGRGKGFRKHSMAEIPKGDGRGLGLGRGERGGLGGEGKGDDDMKSAQL